MHFLSQKFPVTGIGSGVFILAETATEETCMDIPKHALRGGIVMQVDASCHARERRI